ALAAVDLLSVAAELAILSDTANLTLGQALGAGFVVAALVKAAAALLVALLCLGGRPVPALLGLGALTIVLASTMTSHAAARLDDRLPLGLATALHQLGAAVWIGGLPCFLMALAR